MAVLLLGIAGVLGYFARRHHLEAAAPAPGGAWASVTAAVLPDGAVPRDVALRAFALQFGATLPGVGPLPRRDATVPFCGTETLRWVHAHWGDLTVAQRDAITARLARRAAPGAGAAAQLRVTGGDGSEQRAAAAMVSEVVATLSSRLGVNLVGDPVVVLVDGTAEAGNLAYAESFADGPAGTTLEDTRLIGGRPAASLRCRITLGTDVFGVRPLSAQTAVVAHELFHCFQKRLFRGTYDAFSQRREQGTLPGGMGWMIEGGAAWAGQSVAGGADPYARGRWREYLSMRGEDGALITGVGVADAFQLFIMFYNAMPFWDHLDRGGVDLWSRVAALVNAPDNLAAYRVALGGGATERLQTWVSGTLRRRGWDAAWWAQGTGLDDGVTESRPPTGGPRLEGAHPEEVDLSADPGVQRLYTLPVAADAVAVVEGRFTAYGRLTFDGAADYYWNASSSAAWCVRAAGCECPAGTTSDLSVPMRPVGRAAPITLAMVGGPDGAARAQLSATRWDRFVAAHCRPTGAVQPPPSPAGFDPCLTGTWHIDRDSELRSVRATFPSNVRLNRIGGDLTLTFDGRGNGGSAFAQYCFETSVGGAMPMQQKVIFNGTGAGRYTASAGRLHTTDYQPSHLDVRTEVRVAGQRMNLPVPANDAFATAALPGDTGYRCNASELVFEQSGRSTRYTR